MVRIGSPGTRTQTKMLLLGAGELGKEVIIEAQRLGVYTVAVDRYENAPAMQVAHASHVIPMLDGDQLRKLVKSEQPDFIVPEIEAIATDTLLELEAEGHQVVPTARAAHLTMDREGIRRLAAEELHLPVSPYAFANSLEGFRDAVQKIGFPCVVKPVMSSSGKGQSIIQAETEIDTAWRTAHDGARGEGGSVIVEGFIEFEYEITLLTVRHAGGTSFCQPIGHQQVQGDYHLSWQPQPMSEVAQARAESIARTVTDALGGRGVFGVEMFVRGDDVWFSEVSPRPHDTGMVTLVTQELSEFALHVRAILGLPIPSIASLGPGASHVVLASGVSSAPAFEVHENALERPHTSLRLFGKPEVRGQRRLGVGLARGKTLDEARKNAQHVANGIRPIL